jgi:hypothetical protein
MATGNVVLTVVDVGQGQCTFVEVYDTSVPAVLTHALMIDCGTDHPSSQTDLNLDYIVAKVSTMAAPAFDCIVFSHSDNDHISLMQELLNKFIPTKKPTIKQVWYGGNYDQYEKGSFNILDYLVAQGYCTADDLKTTGANYSGYDEVSKQFIEYFWESPEKTVYLYAIASNVMSRSPDWTVHDDVPILKTPVAKNRVSIITALYYGTVSYVICGDAINATMAAVNKHFAGGTTVFNNNVMTTLPHHGSRATGYGVPSARTASVNSVFTVSTFASLLKSQTITASAYEMHSHPSLQLMLDFAPTTATVVKDARLLQKNAHRVTANIDRTLTVKATAKPGAKKAAKPADWVIAKGSDYTFETITNVYSTQYFRGILTFSYQLNIFAEPHRSQGVVTPTPIFNPFACWQYITKADANTTFWGYSNLSPTGVMFTSPPTTSSFEVTEDVEVLQSRSENLNPVTIRRKIPLTGKLVMVRSQFHSRLKQFK